MATILNDKVFRSFLFQLQFVFPNLCFQMRKYVLVQENVSMFAKKHQYVLANSQVNKKKHYKNHLQVDITSTGPELREAVIAFLASKIASEPLLHQCKPFLASFQQCHQRCLIEK